MQSKGLTLLEILVAILILSLLVTGLAGLFVAGKAQILHSRSRIATAELGKYFLDPLQMDVRQDTWGQPSNKLRSDNYRSLNNPFSQYASYTAVAWLEEPLMDNITYYPAYQVIPVGNLRKVKLTITWTERSPLN